MIRFAALALLSVLAGCTSTETVQDTTTGAAPFDRLVQGNARYVEGNTAAPRRDGARRGETSGTQKPFAVIVSCADSRVAPEILFDQGIGDLFVVRVAGQVVEDASLGSVEYAVAALGARLILVVGHEHCGAVKAAVEGGALPGHIGAFVDPIKPGIAGATGEDKVEAAIRANALAGRDRLRTSDPILKKLVDSGELRIEAARYDLDSGLVEILK